ncbi:GtrA family protein [Parapedobacter defluvii]|uniref:GtrA family protein n=1 Tax=Parapedobacter defluvii TaxID=2045106 RepID=UPI000F91D643|nr:MAG: GtrA family protein [Parapedobacter sp.]
MKSQSLSIFAKAQASAFMGGTIDYLTMLFATEVLGIHYTSSIAIGGVVGALANFLINRYWTFQAHRYPMGHQLVRFCLMVMASILLKTLFTYLVTDLLYIDYWISRLCVELIVSWGFNFPLQKRWVFRW